MGTGPVPLCHVLREDSFLHGFRREAELRRCLNEKATQDRPLKPSTEAVHRVEAADEPNLRLIEKELQGRQYFGRVFSGEVL